MISIDFWFSESKKVLKKDHCPNQNIKLSLKQEMPVITKSKPVLENWLKETKDPLNSINETLQNTSEVIKRCFEEIAQF